MPANSPLIPILLKSPFYNRLELVERNRVAGVALASGYGRGTEQRVVDRLLHRLDRGQKERAHEVVVKLGECAGWLLGTRSMTANPAALLATDK